MATSITYDELRGTTPPDTFDLTYTVTASTDIPPEIFVYTATTPPVFQRVATVADFKYPTVAAPLSFDLYRQNTVIFALDGLSVAESTQTSMRASISALADVYQAGTDAWAGSDTVVVP